MAASNHLGMQFYHGSPAELRPGDLIEPNKYPQSHPDSGIPGDPTPRPHTYLTPRREYVTEHYGPNVYHVEPTGPISHDPEYSHQNRSRNPKNRMYRSSAPLRVIRQVSRSWGVEDV
jgi:rifampin ADP-ribosylating transferase